MASLKVAAVHVAENKYLFNYMYNRVIYIDFTTL